MKLIHLRPANPTERQLAMLWGAAAASVVILRPLWIIIAPHLRACTFRRLTGIPCPTCGTTRTALALLDFNIGAFAVNPLATLAGIFFIVGGAAALIWVLLRGPVPMTSRGWSRRWTRAIVAVILINWFYLILTD
jgi:TRAP-type C4-dicarboxylate transport system permease large subunit